MQNKNLEQIRTVIKMFFNEYDMEDIYIILFLRTKFICII